MGRIMGRLSTALSAAILSFAVVAPAVAQSPTDPRPPPAPAIQTDRTQQPQGPTGPVNTDTAPGAPAASPQGETPPGMQSAPQGSSAVVPARPDEKKK